MKIFLCVAIVCLGYILATNAAGSMDFELLPQQEKMASSHRFPDYIAVQASGEIVPGDAVKLGKALQQAGRDEFGNVRLFLNSPGGSVSEAMSMVAMMDRSEVTAIVRNGQRCLSACASVLFLSARIHLMEPGDAEIGLHTCRVGRGIPDPTCNSYISDNAKFHGTNFGTVARWLGDAGGGSDGDMVYLGWANATLWGLIGPPTYDPTLALPSFDCDQPANLAQTTICRSPQLARYEASLLKSHASFMAFFPRSDRSRLVAKHQNQIAAIQNRSGADSDCLLDEYAKVRRDLRMAVAELKLNAVTSQLKKQASSKAAYGFHDLCIQPDECGRPALRDASYEFFIQNFASLLAELMVAEERGETARVGFTDPHVGTSDCIFETLCDPRIKTMNEIAFEADAWTRAGATK